MDPLELESWMEKGRSRLLRSEALHDGTWLLQAAQENTHVAADMTGRSIWPSRSLTWASCCSGSEGVKFCFEALRIIAGEMGQHLRFRHVFSCESNKEKMQWISMVNSCTKECMHKIKKKWQGGDSPRHEGPQDEDEEAEESEDDPCIFMDICQLGGDHASCAVHGKQQRATTKASGRDSTKVSDRARGDQYQLALGNCPIPQVDILILGTSCKDMSRANPNKHKQKEAVLGTESSKLTCL